MRKMQAQHPDRVRQWRKNFRKNNPKSARNSQLKNSYGITLEEYNNRMSLQNDSCAICNDKTDKTLCVDHDHKTGAVRGLLCSKCNHAIGLLKDSPEIITKAASYVALGGI